MPLGALIVIQETFINYTIFTNSDFSWTSSRLYLKSSHIYASFTWKHNRFYSFICIIEILSIVWIKFIMM